MLFSCVSPCRSLQHPYPQFPHESNETQWVPHRRSEETCRNPDSKHHEQRPSIWFTAGTALCTFSEIWVMVSWVFFVSTNNLCLLDI